MMTNNNDVMMTRSSAFEGGWFHTGDLAVHHGNGRVEIKDRSKDIIISGMLYKDKMRLTV
jgi:acyl-CoA synthetase (AMP-forming)/AMP-acid ligase II